MLDRRTPVVKVSPVGRIRVDKVDFFMEQCPLSSVRPTDVVINNEGASSLLPPLS